MTDGGVDSVSRPSPVSHRLSVRLLCVLVLLPLLTGCSLTQTIYNQLDWYFTYYLSKHFDLDREQKAELRVMVDRNLAWHRETQLPQYSRYLRELELAIAEPVTGADVALAYERVLDFWDASMLHIVPDAQVFLSSLSDEQVEQMVLHMEENNQEMFEEYSGSTEAERRKNRDKNTIKGVERALGKMNSEQKQYITDSLAGMQDATEDWMANRRRWQASFIELVESRPPEAEYRKRLVELYVYPRRFDEPEFQETVETNLQAALRMTTYLVNDLTPKQRERARQRFINYAEDFDALAAQGKAE